MLRKTLWVIAIAPLAAGAAELPIFDAHLHYSHDAWESVPPAQAIAMLRKAGVKRALVSSSGDDGQQRLAAQAPDLIIPELRPYRSRADTGIWFRDETVIPYLENQLKKFKYAGIGEFHLYGADADLPVPRRMVQLAKQYGLFLHAHSDADAVELSPDRLHSDGEQILKPLHLTDAGIADLTVFLETLSDRGGRYQRRPFPEDCR
jgi:hypothetical protein